MYYLNELKKYLAEEFEKRLNLTTIISPIGTKKALMPNAIISNGNTIPWRYAINKVGMKHVLFIKFTDNVLHFAIFEKLIMDVIDILFLLDNTLSLNNNILVISNNIRKIDLLSYTINIAKDIGLVSSNFIINVFAVYKNY